jgi:hypothetical protein
MTSSGVVAKGDHILLLKGYGVSDIGFEAPSKPDSVSSALCSRSPESLSCSRSNAQAPVTFVMYDHNALTLRVTNSELTLAGERVGPADPQTFHRTGIH